MTRWHTIKTAARLTLLAACWSLIGCGIAPDIYDPAGFERIPPQQYYVKTVNGSAIGYSTYAQTRDHRTICTIETFHDTFSLLGDPMTWHAAEMTVEDPNGTLLQYDSLMIRNGRAFWFFPVQHRERKQALRNPDGSYTFTAVVNGDVYQENFTWPDGALTMPAFRRRQKALGATPGTVCTADVYGIDRFDTDRFRTEVGPPTIIDLPGGITARAVPLTTTVQAGEGTFTYTEYVDTDFHVLKHVTRAGGVEIVQVACDRDFALRNRPEVPLETLVAIQCPCPIPDDDAVGLAYCLRPSDDGPLALPQTDYQQCVPQPDGTAWLRVTSPAVTDAMTLPYAGDDPEIRRATEPTELIQSDAQVIRDLARRAVGDTTDAAKAAHKIAAFVHRYVHPDTHVVDSTMFPSALEVAEERRGICRHYAVLTAALCRAVGIPAQLVIGYVYTPAHASMENVFIAHAWTQVYLGHAWVPLDATRVDWLGRPQPCGPGYIATHVSNGRRADLADIAASLATFEILAVAPEVPSERPLDTAQTVAVTESLADPGGYGEHAPADPSAGQQRLQ